MYVTLITLTDLVIMYSDLILWNVNGLYGQHIFCINHTDSPVHCTSINKAYVQDKGIISNTNMFADNGTIITRRMLPLSQARYSFPQCSIIIVHMSKIQDLLLYNHVCLLHEKCNIKDRAPITFPSHIHKHTACYHNVHHSTCHH